MGFNIRRVLLVEGPMDGGYSLASHSTAVAGGHVYVWDGGENKDRFVHALTLMESMDPEERARERKVALKLSNPDQWDLTPTALRECIADIPAWRVNLWLELCRYGLVT